VANWDVLIVRESRQINGMEEAELRRMLAAGELHLEDCLRRAGEERWRRVSELKSKSQKGSEQSTGQDDAPAAEEVTLADSPERPGVADSWDEVDGRTVALEPQTMAVPEGVPVPATAGPPAPPPVDAPEYHSEHEEQVSFSRKEQVEPLDMTPMVDVVLLLLLFFMVTASYSMQKILEIPKPDPEKKTAARQSRKDIAKEYIIVELDHRNNILVEDEPLRSRSLNEALKTAATEGNKNKLFLIADGDSFNGKTVEIMDAANEVGLATPIMYSVRTDE
jgi:biopolymer transport protein ExbD